MHDIEARDSISYTNLLIKYITLEHYDEQHRL